MSDAAPLLVNARRAAELCGVSKSCWWAQLAAGRVPLPLRLGRRTLWRSADLADWVADGCPPRDQWQQTRGGRR
ncbi:MAG: hypothetical protein ABFD92_16445 [Planctomycetaceae bacterium]|nr:hypothetical protein [Planctomycetaceae bacterium]